MRNQAYTPKGVLFQNKALSPQIDTHCLTEPSPIDHRYYSTESTFKNYDSPNGNLPHYLDPSMTYSGPGQIIFSSTPQNRLKTFQDPKFQPFTAGRNKHRNEDREDFEYAEDKTTNSDGYFFYKVQDGRNNASAESQRGGGANRLKNVRLIKYQENPELRENKSAESQRHKLLSNRTITTNGMDILKENSALLGQVIASPSNSVESSKAYAKAMKALQEKLVGMEEKVKGFEKEKEENEKARNEDKLKIEQLEKSLEQERKNVASSEGQVKEIQIEKGSLLARLEDWGKEKENWNKEKEELARSNEELRRAKESLEKDLFVKEKEREESEAKNKQAVESLKKLEKDFSEYKKMYHQHLKSQVLKNEALSMEIVQVKEYYDTQIKEFEQELVEIEDEQKKKIEDLMQTIQEQTKRNSELEELFQLKQRELEQVKNQLETQKSSLMESNSRRLYSVQDDNDQVLEDIPGTKKFGFEELLRTNKNLNRAENRIATVSSECRSTERKDKDKQGLESRLETDVSSFMQGRRSADRREQTDISRTSRRSPLGDREQGEYSHQELTRRGSQNEKRLSSQFGGGGTWTPTNKSFNTESITEKMARLIQTASNIGRIEEKDIEESREKVDGNFETGDISKYLNHDDKTTHVLIEPIQEVQMIEERTPSHERMHETVETAAFPRNQSFGNMDGLFSSRGSSIDSSRHPVFLKESTGSFNAAAAKRAHNLALIRENLLNKERDLSQANQQHQDLMNKIKETENTTERLKMRGDLIELTDEIQKINEQIHQLRREEAMI